MDLVYTPRLLRLAGIEGTPPPGVHRREVPVPLLVGQHPYPRVFYYLSPPLPEAPDPHVLRHLAGVAAVRLVLGAEPSSRTWLVDVDPVHLGLPAPDARWVRGNEVWAIEYDAGYPKPMVLEKLHGLARLYPKVVWGVPSYARKRYLEGLIPPSLRDRIQVVLAPWG